MKSRPVLAAAVVAVWATALVPFAPSSIHALAAGFAVLLLPGLALDGVLAGGEPISAKKGALARWITGSVALAALNGIAVSVCGGGIVSVLVCLAATSLVLALLGRPRVSGAAISPTEENRGAALAGDRVALALLALVVLASVWLAAVAPNVARDRMWYLAFITDLASGRTIDWREPFLGTGHLAARFAYNGWLLALAAWSKLGGLEPANVFERMAPPVLTLATASAAYGLATRLLPLVPALAALAAYATLIATRYPFFSPDGYAFFARIAEDKSVALLVFTPVTLAAVTDLLAHERRTASWLAVAVGLVAVGFSHALVLLLLGIALATLLPLALFASRSFDARRVLGVLAISVVIAAIPARLGLLARSDIVDAEAPADAWSDDPTHPVVRAHLRMDRLRELPVGGPIVEPKLLAEPLLLLGLIGVPFAWARRRSLGGAILIATSVPFLTLAFVPFVAPAFGRAVLPWMAYRALWLVPFGYLAAVVVDALAGERTGRSAIVRSLAAIALAVVAIAALPWQRTHEDAALRPRLRQDRDLVALLEAIAKLPADARVAAAPGVSELVPALAGRHVLASADRATVVFAGSRRAAERRMAVAAAISGLAPGNPLLRRGLADANGVTHAVLDGASCARLGDEIFRSGSIRLCNVRPTARRRSPALFALERSANGRPRVAALGNGIACEPTPEQAGDSIARWHRDARWSARALAIDCRATLGVPADKVALYLRPDLPRAREAIVFRSVVTTTEGQRVRRHGLIELDGSEPVVVELGGKSVRAVRFRLVPAYLPYLNLSDLSLLE